MKLTATYTARRGDKKFNDVTMPDKTVYKVNNEGVLTVDDADHIEFLLDTGNFKGEGQPKHNPETMMIKNGDVEIDLMQFDKDALLEFATNELGLTVDARTGEKKLRAIIMEHVAE